MKEAKQKAINKHQERSVKRINRYTTKAMITAVKPNTETRPKLFTLPEGIRARWFCREWFAKPGDTEIDKDEREEEWGYKERCIRTLSRVTGVGISGVKEWGREAGLDFPKMPETYKKTLAYALALKQGN